MEIEGPHGHPDRPLCLMFTYGYMRNHERQRLPEKGSLGTLEERNRRLRDEHARGIRCGHRRLFVERTQDAKPRINHAQSGFVHSPAPGRPDQLPFGRFNGQANLPRSRLSEHHLHATELHGVAMDWQRMTTAAALFPSFDGTEDGCLPTLPVRGPVWTLLNPNEEIGLKAQMSALSGAIDVDNQGFFVRGEGIIIDASATVEAGAYLIGPCYIGPRAVVRS